MLRSAITPNPESPNPMPEKQPDTPTSPTRFAILPLRPPRRAETSAKRNRRSLV